jgi:outer membrane protein OmpA-like peptidoglycan-associated protein
VKAGTTTVINLQASDPSPGNNTVTFSAAGLPSWATLTQTPGNPATATLTLAPPVGTPATKVGINIDATSSGDVPLMSSQTIRVTVDDSPPLGAPTVAVRPADVARVAHYEFTGDPGATFECQVDGGAWTACTSPFDPGLGDGSHTVAIRQVDALGFASEPVTHAFTLDATAPAAPSVLSGPDPSTRAKYAEFSVTGEPGATIECRLDGGAWELCPSPLRLTGLAHGAHTLELRQTDAAGNVSPVGRHGWTVTNTPSTAGAPRLTAVLGGTVAVDGTSAAVGCRLHGTALAACRVKVSVTNAAGRQVVVGHGTARPRKATGSVTVRVELTAVGRRYVHRAGGARALVRVDATGRDGRHYRVTRSTRLLPNQELVLPQDLLFASGSSQVSATGNRYLKGLSRRLQGVKSVTCIGHTDDQGSAAANMQLGFRRAKRVCEALHVGGKVRAYSLGEGRPRASNATPAGRALNRRVTVTLHYR